MNAIGWIVGFAVVAGVGVYAHKKGWIKKAWAEVKKSYKDFKDEGPDFRGEL